MGGACKPRTSGRLGRGRQETSRGASTGTATRTWDLWPAEQQAHGFLLVTHMGPCPIRACTPSPTMSTSPLPEQEALVTVPTAWPLALGRTSTPATRLSRATCL